MRKSTFDFEPELLVQEGSQMRINFDVEQVTEPVPAIDGGEEGERQVFKAWVVRVQMPLTADGVREAALALGFDELKANVMAAQAMFVYNGSSDVAQAKSLVLAKIAERDSSTAVNEFFLNDESKWLPREWREMFESRLADEKRREHETVSLDFPGAHPGDAPITLNVDLATVMLQQLKDYATDCYDKTKEHERAVSALTTVKKVLAYDYTKGYPQKLSFEI
jgi:hypothetical protein